MKVTEIPFNLEQYLRDKLDHPPRTPGLHVSQIYGDIDAILNRKHGEFTDEDLGEFAQIGFLWERVLEDYLADITRHSNPGRYTRIGEIISPEGIIMTPDNWDLDWWGDGSGELGLEEWKCTWKSSRDSDDLERNRYKWLMQIKSYLYNMESTRARLRAIHLVGNWRDRVVPTTRMWEFEFTQRELEDNWNLMLRHARGKKWL